MASKEFAFAFSIGAKMAPSFNDTFISANKRLYAIKNEMWDLAKAHNRVKAAFDKGIINEASFNNANKIIAKTRSNFEKITAGEVFHKAMIDGTALYYTAKNIAGFLTTPIQQAVQFESVMADVKKVVDFDSPQQFKQMSNDILELSKRIPMSAEGLGRIVAAGGQSGIARDELSAFAESAAKMGVAFDITADQAGDMMAKWRTAFKMNQADVIALADKINFLGNTTAASAPLISDVVTRIGPLGEVGGVASGEIAALGASMVDSGIQSEVAATGIKNMILAMVSGESATKAQAAAFAKLGIDTVDLAKRMQTDARGAILGVLESISQLDQAEQASVLQQIFGKESLSAISPLLSNLEGLKQNFEKVGSASNYAGSMEAEFSTRSQTTENDLQLLRNRVDAANIAIGNGLLPVLTPAAEALGEAANKIGDFAAAHPELIKGIIVLGGAIMGSIALYRAWQIASAGCAAVQLVVTKALTSSTAATISERAAVIASAAATKLRTGAVTIATGAQWLMNTAVGVGSNAFRTATAVLKSSAAAQWLMNAAMAACPFAWIIAAVAATVAAGIWLYNNWDMVKQWFITLWNDPALALQQFVDGIKNKFNDAFLWLQDKWESIKKFLSTPIFGSVNITAAGQEGQKIAQNAYGGVYGKGAFLTSFAERDGESAIPHTPNRRNIGLLAATNAIMGNPLGGGNITATFAPQITVQGGTGDTAGQIDTLMTQKMREFEEMLKRIAREQRRVSYA